MKPEEQERRRVNSSAYYHRHKGQVRNRHRERMAPRFAWLKSYKETRPCSDCGNCFPAECMDFDHLPGAKKFHNIAHLLHYKYFSVVEKEIAKCELVCANCHRIRTFSRKRAELARKISLGE